MGGNAHTRPGLSKEKHDANGPTPCWYDRLLGCPFRNVKPCFQIQFKTKRHVCPLLRLAKLQTLIASWAQGWGVAVAWGGGLWPNGQAAGLQAPGLWVQVTGCAQGFLAVVMMKF